MSIKLENGFVVINENNEVRIDFCGHGSPTIQDLFKMIEKIYPGIDFGKIVIRPYILNGKIPGIMVVEQKGIPEEILCPPEEQIESFVNGDFDSDEIRNHLTRCPICYELKEKISKR